MTATVPRLRPSLRSGAPGTAVERELWAAGAEVVVGVDEVGRGSWAGPLTVGAVVIPKASRIYKVRDSKQLTEGEREAMFDRIRGWVDRWAIGHASPQECDRLGMSEAQRVATRRALDELGVSVDHVLIDGSWDFVAGVDDRGSPRNPATTMIVKGDASSLSIASASILAKVTRDRIMRAHADAYPWYAFHTNKGYPCPRHRSALQALGPSTIHRRTWAFMPDLVWSGIPECRSEAENLTLF